MKKHFIVLLFLSILYNSCTNSGKKSNSNKTAKGDRNYGGTMHINEIEPFQHLTLLPSAIIDASSTNIAHQLYEGLVKFNPKDLSIIPCIAEKWKIDPTGTIYTFHLKKGVMFHDNKCFPDGKGREVKSSDFKFSFELLCTYSRENSNFEATFKDRVLGANKFFEASKTKSKSSIEGIKTPDEYTISITLTRPSASFLYALAASPTSVISKEAFEAYGENMKIGTGAFVFAENNSSENIVLTRNKNYHGIDSLGNQLPFLDSIVITFVSSKKQELENFENGKLDVVTGLPAESIKDLVEKQIDNFKNNPPKFMLERSPEMLSQYYEFNLTKAPFNDIKVRQAFSYAIDRNKIVEDVLKGEAYGPGIYGICPPTFKGYDVTKIHGYSFDASKAQKLLAEAGYPNGKGFPKVKIELNSGGSRHNDVVMEIQKQLMDVLNVTVDFEIVPMQQKIEDAKYGRAEIVRTAWLADFPSPENFLWTLYGGTVPDKLTHPSFPNIPRYKNPKYDELFIAGKSAKTQEAGYSDFLAAEQLMINEAPIMVLWYDENYRLIKSNIYHLYSNPLGFRDYSYVYKKDIPVKSNAEKEEIAKN